VYSRKTENVKFPLKASVQKPLKNFFAKIVQSAFVTGFPKSYRMTGSRSNWARFLFEPRFFQPN